MNVAPPLLAAESVSLAFGSSSILDSVSLAVRPGEIVTLIGPNGSGKTTLVRVLLGLIAPSSGRVRRTSKRIGYVPQSFARDRSLPLTALEFAATFGSASKSQAMVALERTGAAAAATRQMSSLSGGEMARVALARALLRKPDLLVLDEPLAGVDLSGEAALYALIADVRRETGAGILLISHDLHVVMAAADHVVCLNHHVCCEGEAHAVIEDPAFLALFGANVARQIAVYSHHHDHTHAPSGAVEHDDRRRAQSHDHAHHGHDPHGHDHHRHDREKGSS